MGTPDGATLLAKEVRSIVGERLDVLVSNAGITKAATIKDHTVADFDNLFATNVRGPFFLVQQLLPVLGEGSNIIVISSLGAHAVVGKPGLDNPSLLAYASTKGAIGDSGQKLGCHSWAARYSRKCSRTRCDRHGYVEFHEDRGRPRGRSWNAGIETNRQTGRCCGRRRVPGVGRGALDHGSEYSGRRWVEALGTLRPASARLKLHGGKMGEGQVAKMKVAGEKIESTK